MGVQSTTNNNIDDMKKELERAERKALNDGAKMVVSDLGRNTAKRTGKLTSNIKKSGLKIVDGRYYIDVGYNNDGWYYKFSDGGVEDNRVVRHGRRITQDGRIKAYKTRPYRLYQKAQNYVRRTSEESSPKVASLVDSYIGQVASKYNV